MDRDLVRQAAITAAKRRLRQAAAPRAPVGTKARRPQHCLFGGARPHGARLAKATLVWQSTKLSPHMTRHLVLTYRSLQLLTIAVTLAGPLAQERPTTTRIRLCKALVFVGTYDSRALTEASIPVSWISPRAALTKLSSSGNVKNPLLRRPAPEQEVLVRRQRSGGLQRDRWWHARHRVCTRRHHGQAPHR